MEVADGFPGVVPIRDSKAPHGPVLTFEATAWTAFIGDLTRTAWRKSSYSNQEGGDCVEVADAFPGTVPVRDSKAPHGPVLTFRTRSWAVFIGGLKAGSHRV
ncbi:DUF397 domain-containing protein [Streptomyces sp. TS71-3]|uniref:DUF397 domain-containing protein n=1 Tax=Streptomyces sp. TS71-3 TaxID=2733862 RepID=UPI001B296A0D|nr:DUF397 domain-containing protein [Streptomyces sp. TS71-3]GHJ34553.1 hypothetical protein Sm713_01620 [Streptomyces sp. TS71-3]